MANSDHTKRLSATCTLPFSVYPSRWTATETFYVMDLGELDAILSCDFMSREGICIDPQARTATVRNGRRGGRTLSLPVALAARDPAASTFSFHVVLTPPPLLALDPDPEPWLLTTLRQGLSDELGR
mmetsp:Transcript_34004/g.76541  ORF Transcript_34004/g.76541 Transcript_34004/m.76541 type:complete len:127 (-) Transcript_34004:1387-1767(-)